MCDRVVSEESSMLKYCLDKYKTQKMYDEAVDDCLSALEFLPDWFVTYKMIRKFHEALLANNILFLNENYGNVTFSSDQMGILSVDLNSIQDGPFWGCSRMGRGQKGPLPKIGYAYLTMMKLRSYTLFKEDPKNI